MCLALPSKNEYQRYFLHELWKRYAYYFGVPYLLDHFSIIKPKLLVLLLQIYMSFSQFYVVNSTTTAVANFDYKYGSHQLTPHHPLLNISLFVYAGFTVYTVWYLFRANQGHRMATPGPYPRTRRLVTSGPFSYVRNPIASAGILFHLVFIVFHPSIRVTIYLAFECYILTAWFELYEEPELGERFGQSYEDYCERVPRWIPNFASYSPIAENPNQGM